MAVKDIDVRHEDYDAIKEFWEIIGLLYRGGYELQRNASKVLRARPVEPPAVYSARLKEFTYQNIIQAGLSWYQSSLFRDRPTVILHDPKDSDPDTNIITDDFLDRFLANADRCGCELVDLAKDWFIKAARDGAVYILIDLPGSTIARNFREQKQSGGLDAFLVTFEASQVINWSEDRFGELEFVVIATQRIERTFGKRPVVIDQWYYFDREEYRLYESAEAEASSTSAVFYSQEDRQARLVESGRHSMADRRRVPVRRFRLPSHLWLSYRVYLQILDHLNQDNAYTWALKQANLAVPVISGPYEKPLVVSETTWIHLPEVGSKFDWSEPPGRSFEHAAKRVCSLREEIHRSMHLQSQGRDSSATASASSGYSKEMDLMPAKDVANEIGQRLKAELKGIVEDVAIIASREVHAEITGLQSRDDSAILDIGEAEEARSLDVQSDEFDKYVQENAAMRFMRQAPSARREKVRKEIEVAPTKSALLAKEEQLMRDQFAAKLDGAIANSAVRSGS